MTYTLPKPKGKPDTNKFKNAKLTRVFLQDEVPRFGCGWRRLWAAVGRKWVWLANNRGQKARMAKAKWNQIVDQSARNILRNTP